MIFDHHAHAIMTLCIASAFRRRPIKLWISPNKVFHAGPLYLFIIFLFVVGVWPFNFWQLNKVNQDPIHGSALSPPGTAYTPFPPEKLAGAKEFTLLLNLSSDLSGSNGYARIVSYSLSDERMNFMIGQWEDSIVFRLRAAGRPKLIHFESDGVLRKGKKEWIAIVFDGEKLLLYHNGEIKNQKKTGILDFSNWDASFPLVIGSEANGNFGWKGNIYSIRIFDRCFLPEEIRTLARGGNFGGASEKPLIDYSFNKVGSLVEDHGKGQPAHSIIPERFKPYKRQFLTFGGIGELTQNRWDVLINILGFIPLGLLLVGYLRERKFAFKNAIFLGIIEGFLISLTIEVLQAYLATRDSSLLDLIANTAGTGIGCLIYLCGKGVRPTLLTYLGARV